MKHMVVTWRVSKTYETNCFSSGIFPANLIKQFPNTHTHARFRYSVTVKIVTLFLRLKADWYAILFIFVSKTKDLGNKHELAFSCVDRFFGGRKTNLIWRLHCFSPLAWGTSTSAGAGVRSTNKKLKKQTWYSWGIHCPPNAFNTFRLDLFPFNMICSFWFV